MGGTPDLCVYTLVDTQTKMKEQLESNLITKFAAGLLEHEEEQFMQEWLQENPQFVSTVALIQQQVEAMNPEPVLISNHR